MSNGMLEDRIDVSSMEGEEEFKGSRIRFVPLWKWLLGRPGSRRQWQ